jgi:hypothetical protein
MIKPRHGKLKLDTNNNYNWIFCPANTTYFDQGIKLPDFTPNCQNLLQSL